MYVYITLACSIIPGIAPLTHPHSPPLIGYREWLGWSRITWNCLPLRSHSWTAIKSRRISRESTSREMKREIVGSAAAKKRQNIDW